MKIVNDLTSMTIDELKTYKASLDAHVASLRETGTLAAMVEAKEFQGHAKTASALIVGFEQDDTETEQVKVEDTKDEDVKDEAKTEEVKAEDTQDETVETTQEVIAQSADEQEATETAEDTLVRTASVKDIQNVYNSTGNGSVGKHTVRYHNPDFSITGLSAEQATRKIASIPTPGRTELSAVQKAYGIRTAASCDPATLLRETYNCGQYEQTIASLFRAVNIDALKVQTVGLFDASDTALVGLVNQDADPIAKDCAVIDCAQVTETELIEVKACFKMKEQTAFSSDLALEQLIEHAASYMLAKLDQELLAQFDALAHPFAHAGVGVGTGDIALGVAETFKRLEEATPLTNTDELVVLVPRSLLAFFNVDNYIRQNSWNADSILGSIFGGRRVVAFDDYIEPGLIAPGLPAPGGAPEALAPTTDWTVRLVNPDAGAVALRAENDYGVNKLGLTEESARANTVSYFGRAYAGLVPLADCGWATIDFSDICLGGRVNSVAACVA